MIAKTVIETAVLPGIQVHHNGTLYVRVGLGNESATPVIFVDDTVPQVRLLKHFDGLRIVDKPAQMVAECSVRKDGDGDYVVAPFGSGDEVLVLYTIMSLPSGRVHMIGSDRVRILASYTREFKTDAGNCVELLTLLLTMDPYSFIQFERTGYVGDEEVSRQAELRRPGRNDYLQSILQGHQPKRRQPVATGKA
jgi:hypothetical protein